MPRDRVEYICKRCDYKTNRKSHYEVHINRKFPCKEKTNVGYHNSNAMNEASKYVNVNVDSHCTYANVNADTIPNMVKENFKCDKCSMNYDNITSLRIHASKCSGCLPLQCPKCKKMFSTRQGKSAHVQNVVCKETAIAVFPAQQVSQPASNATPPQTVQNITAQNSTIQTVNNTNSNNNTTNNNTINIYGLGKEDVSYMLTSKKLPRFVNQILDKQKDGVCDLIYMKHFHPDHPENHNVKKMLKKDPVMHFFDGQTWQRREAMVVARQVLKGAMMNLTEMLDSLPEYNRRIPKDKTDEFMKTVGEPLELDVTGDEYDYEYTQSDEEKQRLAEQISRYINDFIYEHSKKVHKDCVEAT